MRFPPLVPELVHFMALLLIATILLRLIQSKTSNTAIGPVLAFATP